MKARAGEIKAGWNARERDNGWAWGEGTTKADANLVGWLLFGKEMDLCGTGHSTLIAELERRGYDPKTLRFSIRKRQG